MGIKLPLVEREEQQKSIEESIIEKARHSREKTIVIDIHGDAGMGKTYLGKILDNHDGYTLVKYDFEKNTNYSVEFILYKWVTSLEKQGFKFHLFHFAHSKLKKCIERNNEFKRKEIKEKITSNIGLISALLGCVGSIISQDSTVAIVAPVIGVGIEYLNDKNYLDPIIEFKDSLNIRNKRLLGELKNIKENEEGAENSLRQLLVECFVSDIFEAYNDDNRNKPLIFLIDTYDLFAPLGGKKNDEWFEDLAARLNESIWIICGRREIYWEKVNLKKYKLKSLEKQESFNIIFNDPTVDIRNEEHRLYIQQKSGGYPLRLYNCIEQYKEQFGTIDLTRVTGNSEDIFERIVRETDDIISNSLKCCAFLGRWKRKYYNDLKDELLNVWDLSDFDKIKNLSIVKKSGDWFEIDKSIRLAIMDSSSVDFIRQLKDGYGNLIVNSENDFEQREYFELKLNELNRYKNTQDIYSDIYLLRLINLIDSDLMKFESEFLSIWKKPEEICSIKDAIMVALYRKYLVKIRDIYSINDAYYDNPDIEKKIYSYLKDFSDISFDMAVADIFTGWTDSQYLIEKSYYNDEDDVDTVKYRDTYIKMYSECARIYNSNNYDEKEFNSNIRHIFEEYNSGVTNRTSEAYYQMQLLYLDCLEAYLRLDKTGEFEKELICLADNLYREVRSKLGSRNELSMQFLAYLTRTRCPEGFAYARESYEFYKDFYGSEEYPIVIEQKFTLAVQYTNANDYETGLKMMEEVFESSSKKDSNYYINRTTYAHTLYQAGKIKECIAICSEVFEHKEKIERLYRGRMLAEIADTMFLCCSKSASDVKVGEKLYTITKAAIRELELVGNYDDRLCDVYWLLAHVEASFGERQFVESLAKMLEYRGKIYEKDTSEYMEYEHRAHNLIRAYNVKSLQLQ